MITRWSIKAYAGWAHPTAPPQALVLHTTHRSESSKDIEVAAFRERMKRGEISHIEVLDHENARTEDIGS